jgi:hypothetical protein
MHKLVLPKQPIRYQEENIAEVFVYGPSLCVEPKKVKGTDPSPTPDEDGPVDVGKTP